MDSADLTTTLRRFYTDRTANDATACLAHFREDAVLHYAGSPDASAFARVVESRAAVEAVVEEVITLWTWTRCDVLDLLVDGNRAAARIEIDVTHTPSGRHFTTQLMDLWEFDDSGRAIRMTEFADTATIAQLLAS